MIDTAPNAGTRPRLGFLGVGWIGRHRMEAIAKDGAGEIACVADPVADAARDASGAVGCSRVAGSLDELLDAGVDAVVIATPSALHAEQSIRALERGVAVFCQKPLGRDATETRRVVDAARAANRLLGVDLSYRHTAAVRAMRERLPELGRVHAVDLVFHNAYGPDKPWFYDPKLAGGGCVMDLGIHLVDLALWMLGFPEVKSVQSQLFHEGRLLASAPEVCEDYAVAQLELAGGVSVRVACSWRLPAGRDCVIEASFYGTKSALSMQNLDGSFYDFQAEMFRGTTREVLAVPPDAWGGRAAVAWARRLAADPSYDPAIESVVAVAEALDRIYRR